MTRTVTDKEIAQAREATRQADEVEPRAVAARYDSRAKRLVVTLTNGVILQVPVRLIQGVSGGTAQQIASVEIWGDGYALHWEELDADITVPGLAAGLFGTRKWMRELNNSANSSAAAALLGHRGGRTITAVKSAAARANGQLGGRPRKNVTV